MLYMSTRNYQMKLGTKFSYLHARNPIYTQVLILIVQALNSDGNRVGKILAEVEEEVVETMKTKPGYNFP